MRSYANELQKIATYHDDQATDIQRSHSDDALASSPALTGAISSHQQKAQALRAEADQAAQQS